MKIFKIFQQTRNTFSLFVPNAKLFLLGNLNLALENFIKMISKFCNTGRLNSSLGWYGLYFKKKSRERTFYNLYGLSVFPVWTQTALTAIIIVSIKDLSF